MVLLSDLVDQFDLIFERRVEIGPSSSFFHLGVDFGTPSVLSDLGSIGKVSDDHRDFVGQLRDREDRELESNSEGPFISARTRK